MRIAETKLLRYIATLELFCKLSSLPSNECILLSSVPYGAEYVELKNAGLLIGEVTHTNNHENLPDGTQRILNPSITVAGVERLLQLAEYKHRNSIKAKVLSQATQLWWLFAGALIAVVIQRYVGTTQQQ